MKLEDFEFIERGPAITEADLAAFEARIKAALPEDYKGFLLKYNGGLSKLCVSDDPPLRIENWFSLCTKEKLPRIVSIEKVIERLNPDLGKELFPIGEDIANRVVVMKLANPNKFGIGEWDPEEPGLPDIKISFKSFAEMLEHLQHSDEFV